MLKKLEDIDKLVSLTTLHLRDNQIETLDGFSPSNDSVEYINFRYVCRLLYTCHVYLKSLIFVIFYSINYYSKPIIPRCS